MSSQPQWLLPREAAEALGLTRMGVLYQVRFRLLPALQFDSVRTLSGHEVVRIEACAAFPDRAAAKLPPAPITAAALADWLRVSVCTIRRMVRNGTLTAERVGTGQHVIDRDSAKAFVSRHYLCPDFAND